MDPGVGSGCRLASLASCPYHTGRAEGALCGPSRLLLACQAVDRVVFKIYFILITKVVHTVGECASNHISVCPFSCRHSLCEPSRGDCFVDVHFYIYTVFMGNLIHFFKVKFLVTFYFDISCSQSTLVDPIPRFTN